MKLNSWLSYLNLVTLVMLIFVCIALAIVGGVSFNSGGYALGLTIAMIPKTIITIAASVIIGFLLVLAINIVTNQGEKAGWYILIATALFIPAAFCLVSLAIFALPMFGK